MFKKDINNYIISNCVINNDNNYYYIIDNIYFK